MTDQSKNHDRDVRRYPIWMTRAEAEHLLELLNDGTDSLSASLASKTRTVLNLKIH